MGRDSSIVIFVTVLYFHNCTQKTLKTLKDYSKKSKQNKIRRLTLICVLIILYRIIWEKESINYTRKEELQKEARLWRHGVLNVTVPLWSSLPAFCFSVLIHKTLWNRQCLGLRRTFHVRHTIKRSHSLLLWVNSNQAVIPFCVNLALRRQLTAMKASVALMNHSMNRVFPKSKLLKDCWFHLFTVFVW